jgi:hypothetical protein
LNGMNGIYMVSDARILTRSHISTAHTRGVHLPAHRLGFNLMRTSVEEISVMFSGFELRRPPPVASSRPLADYRSVFATDAVRWAGPDGWESKSRPGS